MDNGYASKLDVRNMGDDVITRVSDLMTVERGYRQQQHVENQQLLYKMLEEAQRTNGRVTRLESAVATLKEEFQAVRKRWHDFRESVQDTLAKAATGAGELSHVTRMDLKTAFGIYVAGIGTLMLLFKILGKV